MSAHKQWDLVWCWVPYPNWAGIADLCGEVNKETDENPLFFGFPPETVLFLGLQAESTFHAITGTLLWRLIFKFQIRQVDINLSEASGSEVGGWNHFLNPSPTASPSQPQYQRITTLDGDPVFVLGNMYELFYPGSSDTIGGQDDAQQIENATPINLLTNEPQLNPSNN